MTPAERAQPRSQHPEMPPRVHDAIVYIAREAIDPTDR
jgi:hypothetical protein